MKRLLVAVLVTSLAAACGDTEKIVYVYPDGYSIDGGFGSEDASGLLDGFSLDGVALGDLSAPEDSVGQDTPPDPEDTPVEPDVPVVEGPNLEAETQGDTVYVDPEKLDGLFIFGLGIEPQSTLGAIGNTVAGSLALPAVVELDGEFANIRVYDLQAGQAVDGEQGVIESYPYVIDDEGRARIDFGKPEVTLEVQLYGNCTYGLTNYILIDEPLFADGLLTWTTVEQYASSNCGNQGLPTSMGINVHYLRRFETETGFVPRAVDPEMPFGFFQIEVDEQNWMTRLPHIGPEFEDEQVVYYLDQNFPEDLRPLAQKAVDHWNIVLEATAGNRPFVLKENAPTLVAWDPRYRVIAWDESKQSGAIAPFTEHPATGEMIDTDVVVWLANFDQMVESYSTMLNEGADLPYDFGVSDATEMELPDFGDDAELPPRVLRRRAFSRRPLDLPHLAQFINSLEVDLTREQIKELIILDFLTHELGHNLGLRHNFKASADHAHKLDTITSTSCMDYVIGMTHPGSYDADAMRYGYGAGANDPTFMYCTDEDVMWDPACERWDLGHPVAFVLDQLDNMSNQYPPGTSENDLDYVSQAEEWYLLFRKLRQFFNSEYETYDPDLQISTFMGVLERVLCHPYVPSAEPEEPPVEPPGEDAGATDQDAGSSDPGDAEAIEDVGPGPDEGLVPEFCPIHDWFRGQWALYLLYTKFSVDGEWYSWPELNDEQRAILYDAFFQFITSPDQPDSVKQTIINKLPTSAVPGAPEFLQELYEHYSEMEDLEGWEQQILGWIENALG